MPSRRAVQLEPVGRSRRAAGACASGATPTTAPPAIDSSGHDEPEPERGREPERERRGDDRRRGSETRSRRPTSRSVGGRSSRTGGVVVTQPTAGTFKASMPPALTRVCLVTEVNGGTITMRLPTAASTRWPTARSSGCPATRALTPKTATLNGTTITVELTNESSEAGDMARSVARPSPSFRPALRDDPRGAGRVPVPRRTPTGRVIYGGARRAGLRQRLNLVLRRTRGVLHPRTAQMVSSAAGRGLGRR
jgi:hypothetical protein